MGQCVGKQQSAATKDEPRKEAAWKPPPPPVQPQPMQGEQLAAAADVGSSGPLPSLGPSGFLLDLPSSSLGPSSSEQLQHGLGLGFGAFRSSGSDKSPAAGESRNSSSRGPFTSQYPSVQTPLTHPATPQGNVLRSKYGASRQRASSSELGPEGSSSAKGEKEKEPSSQQHRKGPSVVPENDEEATETATTKAPEAVLNKFFGYQRNITAKYELKEEVGRGHFGHTCKALVKKGERKGTEVAVKIIPKAKMTSAISIEDVRREVKILSALAGHELIIHFYDAYENEINVYIAMELCEGGELLERILEKGGRYSEPEAITVMRQILSIVGFCHQQGVVHRDLKPENFLFSSKDENASLRAIDFGLSDFVKLDQRLNDIVGSAYYIAPEVLHRAYSVEADIWSVGVIAYILLCGSRPFWARTESGIFRAVLRTEPSFSEGTWTHTSEAAADFVRQCLSKDLRRRPTAAQALAHPWLRGGPYSVPLDVAIYRSVRAFLKYSPLRQHALRALTRVLTEDELVYLRIQFDHLDTHKEGFVDYNSFSTALHKVVTEAMKESKGIDIMKMIDANALTEMDFAEFCAACVNVYQLEADSSYIARAKTAYEYFLASGHAGPSIPELSKEIAYIDPTPSPALLVEWTNRDGRVSLLGFTRLLHGPSRSRQRAAAAQRAAAQAATAQTTQ